MRAVQGLGVLARFSIWGAEPGILMGAQLPISVWSCNAAGILNGSRAGCLATPFPFPSTPSSCFSTAPIARSPFYAEEAVCPIGMTLS